MTDLNQEDEGITGLSQKKSRNYWLQLEKKLTLPT
jgi:hypothetical protein